MLAGRIFIATLFPILSIFTVFPTKIVSTNLGLAVCIPNLQPHPYPLVRENIPEWVFSLFAHRLFTELPTATIFSLFLFFLFSIPPSHSTFAATLIFIIGIRVQIAGQILGNLRPK